MKRLIVFIKQVPDTAELRIDPKTNTMIRTGVPSIINPFDMYAIEEALRIKEKWGDTEVIVATMGPPQAEEALREALSLGCDKAILLTDRKFAASDTFATSYILSKAVEKIGDYNIILTGKQATDGDTAQVGPGIASWLNIPSITYVKKMIEVKSDYAKIERLMDYGYDIIEIKGKFLMTAIKDLNEPRIPSFRGKMAAKKAEIPNWDAAYIGAEDKNIGFLGSPTRVVKAFSPPPKQGGIKTEGDDIETAKKLIANLKESHLI
ncbi:electron transfer flavoprotein subunit beta/FixA family protein [bacterium]|nr:electron transfer flavoprotein subunit beta/FixA family protein [bacterium]